MRLCSVGGQECPLSHRQDERASCCHLVHPLGRPHGSFHWRREHAMALGICTLPPHPTPSRGRAGRGQRRAGLVAQAGLPTLCGRRSCGLPASAAITTAEYGPARGGGRGLDSTPQDRRSRATRTETPFEFCVRAHTYTRVVEVGSSKPRGCWLGRLRSRTRAAHARPDHRGRRPHLGMVPTNGGTGSYRAAGSGGRPPRKPPPVDAWLPRRRCGPPVAARTTGNPRRSTRARGSIGQVVSPRCLAGGEGTGLPRARSFVRGVAAATAGPGLASGSGGGRVGAASRL